VWEEWKDKGFVILALSDESKSEIERFIESYKPTYPIGSGSRSGDRYGVQGYPSAFLIDHEGTVIWEGHPGDTTWETMIPTALAAAADMKDAWDPGERPAALKRAVDAAKAGTMGKAWKESELLKAKAAEDADLNAAIEAFQKDFLTRAGERTQRKSSYLTNGRYWEASLFFERQIKVFDGSPPAEEWKALLADWKKDKTAKANMDLDKRRLAALDKARAGEKDKAIKELRGLLEKAEGLAVKAAIQDSYQKVGTGG
jgi:tetratricopeptide (TPR) repeat protein